jgi:hypothetical protein
MSFHTAWVNTGSSIRQAGYGPKPVSYRARRIAREQWVVRISNLLRRNCCLKNPVSSGRDASNPPRFCATISYLDDAENHALAQRDPPDFRQFAAQEKVLAGVAGDVQGEGEDGASRGRKPLGGVIISQKFGAIDR